MRKIIYMDHAAGTPLDPRVKAAMEPYWGDKFGNPSSLYGLGREAKSAIEISRRTIAKILNCEPGEIVFTNGGTESVNLAILGIARGSGKVSKPHIITSTIEHHAVLNACGQLEKEGFEVTYLPVNEDGLVRPEDVRKEIKLETVLVSVMYANNEIGTIQPIQEIGNFLKTQEPKSKPQNNGKVLFHTDACQAAGFLELDVEKSGVDLLTLNGSKIYGPKGIGLLYVRTGTKLQPLMFGGSQENEIRPGTENVPAIVGLAEALKISQEERQAESKRLIDLRDTLINGILSAIPKSRLNGHPEKRLPNNVNVSFLDVEGEAIILALDAEGIAASTGSACTAGDLKPSHVLLALGLSHEGAHGSLRLTLGKSTTGEDIKTVLRVLPRIIDRLRRLSPLDLPVERFMNASMKE